MQTDFDNVENKNPSNDNGATPLYIAAQNGHVEVCTMIIDNVKDKNPACNDGLTPLHIAAKKGHYRIFKMIINVAEEKNPVFKNGSTPLALAKDPFIRNLIQRMMNNTNGEETPRKK